MSAEEFDLATAIAEKVKLLDGIELKHSGYKRVKARIELAVKISSARQASTNVVLYGLPGAGKTTLSKMLVKMFGPVIEDKPGYVIRTVGAFYAQLPSPVTVSSLVSTMLSSLGDPKPNWGATKDRTDRLIALLTETRTRLVLLDEFHHLLVSQTAEEVLNWIKMLLDSCPVTFTLIGMPTCSDLIRRDKQIARRFEHRLNLGYLSIVETNEDGVSTFVAYLRSYALEVKEALGLKAIPDFESPAECLAVFAKTGGAPGAITALFRFAVLNSMLNRNDSRILFSDIKEAAEEDFFEEFKITKRDVFDMDSKSLYNEILTCQAN